MYTRLFTGLLATGVLLISSWAQATGFRNPPEGAAALGRVGGRIAQIDDASAIVNNPANLAYVKDGEILASYMLVYSDVKYTDPSGISTETKDKDKHIPNFFGAMGIGEDNSVMLGLGVTSPWGQSTIWPEDRPFLGTAPYHAELVTINLSPTIAARIADRVLVGAGVDIMYSELDLRQHLPLLGVGGPLTSLRLQGDGEGFGFHAGVTWEVVDDHRLAATYRSPIEIDYDGDTDVGGFVGPLAPRSSFSSEIEFPTMVGLGYGIELSDDLRVGIDVEWIEFSKFDEFPVDVGVNGAFGLFPPSIPQLWDDTWTFGIGGDYQLNEAWVLRAGYIFMESPVPQATLSPTLPDDDRNVFSVGAGYHGQHHGLDIAYAINVFDRDVTENAMPAFNGEYELTGHLAQVSYRYAF